MITASDNEILKNTIGDVPVTREILYSYGFKESSTNFGYVKYTTFIKEGMTLTEYTSDSNPAVITSYGRCYSCKINFHERSIGYVIYTVKQLKIFLQSYEEIQQLKMQTDKEIDRIGEQLHSTLLQRNDH